MFENIDLGGILEEKTRELVKGLLNFIEQLSSSLLEARVVAPKVAKFRKHFLEMLKK